MPRDKHPTKTSTDFVAHVPRPAGAGRAAPAVPPPHPAAAGAQTVPSYTPTDAELRFIEKVWAFERTGKIREGIAGQVECIQLQKLFGAKIDIAPDELELLRTEARAQKVHPRF